MNKIAIVSPYFGKLPKNINLTIESMKKNKFIDWYIITDDCEISSSRNVSVIYKNFEEIKELIKKKIHTTISYSYKLCDYKPTYGILFEDLLSKYEMWGYYDLDVIFKDLSKFITNDIIKKYDKIYDLGHLSVMKNTSEIREAFTKTINISYKTLLNDDAIFVFDETYDKQHKGINGILERLNYKVYDKRTDFADVSIKYSNFIINNFKKEKKYYFEYDDGNLYLLNMKNKKYKYEVAYIHLQKRKTLPILIKNTDRSLITPKGIIGISDIGSQCFYKINWRFFWYLKFRVSRKIKNIKTQKKLNYKF